MATSVVESYSGSGTYWWSDSRTVSATTKNALYTMLAESAQPTYTAVMKAVPLATANSHLFGFMADGTNYTRLKWIRIWQSTLAGAVNCQDLSLILLSTAGTGGGAISARPMDTSDTNPYAGGIATLNTVKGTETNTMGTLQLGIATTNPMTNVNYTEWGRQDNLKPLILGTAATSGVALKNINAIASAKVDIEVWFTVSPYL